MKKLYSLFILAFMMFAASFSAGAQLTCDLKWDIPGSVKVYVGGSSEKYRVEVPADATSYHVSYDNEWGSVYVKPADGYVMENAVCEDDNATIAYNANVGGVNISLTTHETHTVKVNVAKIEYDKEITVDIVSSGIVTVTFNPTGREEKIGYGSQKIQYDSKHETSVSFVGPTSVYDAESNPTGYEDGVFYLKQNDTDLNWKLLYGSWKHDAATLTGDDSFEVKLNSNVPEHVAQNVDMSLTIPDGLTFSLVRNWTLSESIEQPLPNSLTILEGTDIQFSWYANGDFDVTSVTLDGAPVTINTSGDYKNVRFTVPTGDCTLVFEGTAKKYTFTEFTAWVVNPEALEVWQGNKSNPGVSGDQLEIHITEETNASAIYFPPVTVQGVTVCEAYTLPAGAAKKVTFQVSSKYNTFTPYILNENEYYKYQFRNASMGELEVPCSDQTSYLIINKIDRSTPALVYTDNASKVLLRSNSAYGRSAFGLENGVNTVLYDPIYDMPMLVALIDVTEDDPSLVQSNGVAIAADSETGAYNITTAPEKIIINTSASSVPSSKFTVTRQYADATITVDGAANASAAFNADVLSKVVISEPTPQGAVVKVNGTEVKDLPYSVIADGTNYSVAITAEKPQADLIQYSVPTDEAVESLASITVTFPNATTVTRNPDMANDEVLFRMGWNWAASSIEITESAAAANSFVFTFTPEPYMDGKYTLLIPEGFFIIDGVANPDDYEANFTLKIPFELAWNFSPQSKIISETYINAAIVFNEGKSVRMTQDFADNFSLSFNGKTVSSDSYTASCEANYFMITLKGYKDQVGTLTMNIGAGALVISDTECPAIEHSWEVVAPKEFEMEVDPEGGYVESLGNVITVSFPDAETAEVFNPNGITLADVNYFAANRYNESAQSIELVEDADCPTFKVTFASAPSATSVYKLQIWNGTFLIDGVYNSSTKEINYVFFAEQPVFEPVVNEENTAFQAVKVTFPAARPGSITLTDDEDTLLGVMVRNEEWSAFSFGDGTVTEDPAASVPTFVFELEDPITVWSDKYYITVPEGLFLLEGEDCPDFWESFAFHPDVDLSYTLDPKSGTTFEATGEPFTVKIQFKSSAYPNEAVEDPQINITYNGEPVSLENAWAGYDESDETWSTIFLTIDDADLLSEPGLLEVTLGQGIFLINGVESPEIHAQWNFVSYTAKEYTWYTVPSSVKRLPYLDKLIVVFPGVQQIEIMDPLEIELINEEAGFLVNPVSAKVIEGYYADDSAIELEFDRIETDGSYTLRILSGALLFEARYINEEITDTFIIDVPAGIDAIENGADEPQAIYNLQGIPVGKDFKSLPAGVYIVNGRKVIKN